MQTSNNNNPTDNYKRLDYAEIKAAKGLQRPQPGQSLVQNY